MQRLVYLKAAPILILFLILSLPGIIAQELNENYERYRIGDLKDIHSSISLSPANNDLVAISGNRTAPVYIYDWKNDAIISTFNVENWYAGSSIEYSSNGNYIILNQLFYTDWSANKDKKVFFVIIDANIGNKVLKIDESNEVKITPDEKKALSLKDDMITEYDLSSGKETNNFKLVGKGFSFDLSPDGNFIAVSHKPLESELKAMPQFKKDKDALKFNLKYKQQVTVYSYPAFERVGTVSEFYDYIYELKFTDDNSQLFCLQIPHAKAQTGAGGSKQTYLSIINTAGWEPIRKAFVSKALYQPDFKLSQDGRFLGIVSQGGRFAELHVYNYESRKLLDRFEFSFRLIESDEDGLIISDSRPAFVFLPDGESILMTIGNRLIMWKFKQQ